MDCSKLSSISSICFSSVTWMKTLRLGPSLAASRRVTLRAMTPVSSSALTRARHGEGDKPTRSASARLVRLASSWISVRIRMSVGSRAFFSRLCLRRGVQQHFELIFLQIKPSLAPSAARRVLICGIIVEIWSWPHELRKSRTSKPPWRYRSGGDGRMAGCARVGRPGCGSGPGRVPSVGPRPQGQGARGRNGRRSVLALSQFYPARTTTSFSRRYRDGGADHGHHPVERARHGGSRQQGLWRTRRPYRELRLRRRDL